ATQRFNDYYFDSKQFPDCSYSGIIEDIATIGTHQNGKYKVHCKGLLTMRGVSKPVNATGELIFEQNQVRITSEFLLDPRCFGMRIPESIDRFYMKEMKVLVEAVVSKKAP